MVQAFLAVSAARPDVSSKCRIHPKPEGLPEETAFWRGTCLGCRLFERIDCSRRSDANSKIRSFFGRLRA